MENNAENFNLIQEGDTEYKEKTAEEWFDLGKDAWLEDFEKCVFSLENAIRLGLSDVQLELQAHAILGNVYNQKLERYSDAIKEYEKALEIDEKEFDGKCLKSINFTPDDNNWTNWKDLVIGELSDCYGSEAFSLLTVHNDVDKAIEFIKKGLSLDENSIKCQVVLGNCYWAKENWRDTIDAYDKVDIESLEQSLAITIIGQLIDAHKNIGDHHFALDYLDKLLKLDPANERAKKDKETCARIIAKDDAIKSENTESGIYWYALGEKMVEEENIGIDTINAFKNALKVGDLLIFEEAKSNALLGIMFGKRDMQSDSKICLKRALDLNDQNDDILRKKNVELYATVCRFYALFIFKESDTDKTIKLLEIPIELGYKDLYDYFDYRVLGELYSKSAAASSDLQTKIYKLEKSIDYLEVARDMADPDDIWPQVMEVVIKSNRDEIYKLQHPEIEEIERKNEIRNNPEKIEEIKTKITKMKSEINRLEENRTKKFNLVGEIAYSNYKDKSVELTKDSKIKLQDILAIEKLIEKVIQEIDNIKSREKKTGFLAKLGDTVSSTTKQGKLKLDLYNLEKKKKNAFTDFGEVLWISQKNGREELVILADIWKDITEMEKQINNNEEEINTLSEIIG